MPCKSRFKGDINSIYYQQLAQFDKNFLIPYINSNLSMREIGRMVGLSRETLRFMVKRLDLEYIRKERYVIKQKRTPNAA